METMTSIVLTRNHLELLTFHQAHLLLQWTYQNQTQSQTHLQIWNQSHQMQLVLTKVLVVKGGSVIEWPLVTTNT